MLFDFKLRPLEDIAPWGTPPDLSLSWFGLTDGYYRVQVGGEHLFNYTDQISKHWATNDPTFSGAYVDYQVVRLWEDVCAILPDVMQPIPTDFLRLVSGRNPTIRQVVQTVGTWWQSLADDEMEGENEDTYYAAITWASSRNLDALYLRGGPRIWIFSHDDTVTITWDNRGIEIDGIEVWSARCGSYSMSRSKFLEEIRSFDRRLLTQMQERVDQVCADWKRPEIRIAFEQLRREHLERGQTLPLALRKSPTPVDWTQVQAALKKVGNF
ncbi:MAG: hypothetical protein JNL39_19295 [Opitutaceae bacterium]|nr:hypothetical protein [Opitutaceae bacterium]